MVGCFEMTLNNADKGLISREIIEKRIGQFKSKRLPIVLTKYPLFELKCKLFNNCIFVIGLDTAMRLINPKYYENDKMKMLLSFERVRHYGCKFLVAGRKSHKDEVFKKFEDLEFPDEVRDLFEEITEEEFRYDISSSEIRASQKTI